MKDMLEKIFWFVCEFMEKYSGIITFIFVAIMIAGVLWIEVSSEKPVNPTPSHCYSKVRGSRPSCWNESDWEAFCKYVECKE